MNKHLNIYRNNIIFFTSFLFFTLAIVSCSVWDDDDNDCPTGFRIYFKYDYNMKFADAFANEVDRVTVFIFDSDGQYLMQKSEEGDVLRNKDYYMTLDINPGNYQIIAWGGLTGSSFRLVEDLITGTSGMEDLHVAMLNAGNTSSDDLHPLWHGEIMDVTIPADRYREVTVSLIKDTNRIRLVMQQTDGVEISNGYFAFEITDDNTLLDFHNNIISSGNNTYLPYASGSGSVGDVQPASYVYYEAHTSRLMANSGARLRVTRVSDGNAIIDIPLIQYLLLTEMEGHKETMDSQEYLDRQDEYSLIFFLDENLNWLTSEIIVNGWTVRFNNGEFS